MIRKALYFIEYTVGTGCLLICGMFVWLSAYEPPKVIEAKPLPSMKTIEAVERIAPHDIQLDPDQRLLILQSAIEEGCTHAAGIGKDQGQIVTHAQCEAIKRGEL